MGTVRDIHPAWPRWLGSPSTVTLLVQLAQGGRPGKELRPLHRFAPLFQAVQTFAYTKQGRGTGRGLT